MIRMSDSCVIFTDSTCAHVYVCVHGALHAPHVNDGIDHQVFTGKREAHGTGTGIAPKLSATEVEKGFDRQEASILRKRSKDGEFCP